jgi:hypothetical protein
MLRVGFSFYIGLFIALQSYGAPLCADVLAADPVGSTTSQTGLSLRQDGTYFNWIKPPLNSRLGEGLNGVVDLVTFNGEIFALKTYKSSRSDHFSQIQRDYRGLRFLRKYQGSFSFKVPNVVEVERNEMRLSYFEGRSLEELLLDQAVSPELKTILTQKYSQALDEIQSVISDFQYVERGADYLKAEEDGFAFGDIFLIIKTSNFIVNPRTLELALIDPH